MAITIISSFVVFLLLAWGILRLLSELGVPFPDRAVFRYLTAKKGGLALPGSPETVTRKDLLVVFSAAVAFRVFVFAASALVVLILSNGESLTFSSLVSHWNLWDGPHYINIATGGYTQEIVKGMPTTLVFFPLYPLLVKLVYVLVRSYELAALLVSTLCYAAACCVIFQLITLEYKKSTAYRTVLFLSIFPFAFYFGGMMSESVFLLTTVLTLYFIKQHRWAAVGICGALSALSRSVGVFIVAPAVIEFLIHYDVWRLLREKQFKKLVSLIFSRGLWLCLIALGTLIYLFINYKIGGSPFAFLKYQKEIWYQESTYFGKSLQLIFSNALSQDNAMLRGSIWIPQVLIYLMTAAALCYGMRRHQSKYTIYLVVYCIVNTSMSWPISGARYMACAFPLFIILADFSDRHRVAGSVITAIFAVGFGIYLCGYLLGKQIM